VPEQLLAGHAEEAAGVVVGLDEMTEVEVEDDDGMASVIEDGSEALLGVAGEGKGFFDGGVLEDEGETCFAAGVADVLAGDTDLEDAAIARAVAPVGGQGVVLAVAEGGAQHRDVFRRADVFEGERGELGGGVAVERAG
jgi:hypothetical protein